MSGGTRGPNGSIETWRRRMEAIDDQLVGLLNSRAVCALEIGRLSRTTVQAEEAAGGGYGYAALERVRRLSPGPLQADTVQRLFEPIVEEGLRLEGRPAEVIK